MFACQNHMAHKKPQPDESDSWGIHPVISCNIQYMMRMHIEVHGHLCMRVLIDCIWSMFQCDSAHLRCRVSMPFDAKA